MVSFLNSWTSGVVVSVIIGTIIEMILPDGNNKKYIKMVIGVFILFTIISPVLSNVLGEIDLRKFINLDEYSDLSIPTSSNIIDDNDVFQVYEQNIKNDIINTIKKYGFKVISIDIRIADSKEEYGQILEIYLQLEESETDIEHVEKIDINISKQNFKEIKLNEEKKQELINVLMSTYGIKKENIVIN